MSKLQQDYIHRVEEKLCHLDVVDGKGVRVLAGKNTNNTEDTDGDDKMDTGEGQVVIPTTEELASYIHENETYDKIEQIQQDALQRAEEKVAIAHQTYSLVDNICKRLDHDLTELEKLLQVRQQIQDTMN